MSSKTKLPPDPEKMNAKRAKWAGAAIAEFAAVTGCEEEDSLGDLLARAVQFSGLVRVGRV
jgi:hypothetical protein